MQPGRRIAGIMIMLGAMLALSLTTVGCNDNDIYSRCDLPPGADCETGENDRKPSCAEAPSFQCNSGACGRYKGSDGYCTERCEADSDCENGTCETFILITDDKFCVPSDGPTRDQLNFE
jgi:hypothetical protein